MKEIADFLSGVIFILICLVTIYSILKFWLKRKFDRFKEKMIQQHLSLHEIIDYRFKLERESKYDYIDSIGNKFYKLRLEMKQLEDRIPKCRFPK